MTPSTGRMSNTPGSAPPTAFRGAPRQLTSSLTIEPRAAEVRASSRVTATLQGAEVQAVTVFRSGGGHPEVRVSLQARPTTAPGRYPGSLEIDGLTVPIVAEVEPSPRVQSEPSRLVLDVEPRSTVTSELRLLNTGNVPVEVPVSSTFCLLDGGGIEHAVWVALTGEPTPDKQRIDLLLDDLAESHGGLVRARTAKRQGPLPPGEARDVHLTLRFSERLRPGRRYAGAWDLEGLRLPVRVSAVGPAAGADERETEDA
jgi:hypothetical protein